ncbi:bifunctional oligoribonuclease/PAP phosphatase NrnA, partial [Patescibacteria group bacterium]
MDIKFRYKQVLEALSGVEKVAVVAHQKPDGDTLGAGSALMHFLRSRGVKVSGFCLDEVPDQYVFLPESERFMTDPDVIRLADLVIVCDAGDLRYAGVHDIFDRMPKCPKMINIDHHKTNEMFGDVNVVNTKASSTAEVLHDFFMYIGAEITQDMATALLTGVVFDTGNFTNPA